MLTLERDHPTRSTSLYVRFPVSWNWFGPEDYPWDAGEDLMGTNANMGTNNQTLAFVLRPDLDISSS